MVHLMSFYCKIPLDLQFLEVKKNNSMYNLQWKTVIWQSHNSLRDTFAEIIVSS